MQLSKIASVLAVLVTTVVAAQSPGVSLSAEEVYFFDTLRVEVHLDSLGAESVLSCAMRIGFPSDMLRYLRLTTDDALTGDSGFSVAARLDEPGAVALAASGTRAIADTGILCRMVFVARQNSGSASLSFTGGGGENYFNEGTEALAREGCSFRVHDPNSLGVTASRYELVAGDTLHFDAQGGTAPYTWSTTDTAVATIGAGGVLTAKSTGTVRVRAEDAGRLYGLSPVVDIAPLSLSLEDTAAYQRASLVVPVTASIASGELLSGGFVLSWDDSRLRVDSVTLDGTLLSGAEVVTKKSTNRMSISFASAEGIGGEGILFGIACTMDSLSSGTARITLADITVNESVSLPAVYGDITVEALPALTVEAGTTRLLRGDTTSLSCDNATGGVTWAVDDTTVATIDEAGILTARGAGDVRVLAVDSIGGRGLSPVVRVYDIELSVDDTICAIDSMIALPLWVGTVTSATAFGSIELDLRFNDAVVRFEGATGAGAVSSWMLTWKETAEGVRIVGAGSAKVDTARTLLLVTLRPDTGATIGQSSAVRFGRVSIDEGAIVPLVTDGSIEIVNKVNVAPVITGQDTLAIPEDSSLSVTTSMVTVEDADNLWPDDFTLLLSGGDNYTVEGTTILPDSNYFGRLQAALRVSDGIDTSDAFVLDIDVTPVNDMPVVTGQADTAIAEDDHLIFTPALLDVADHDDLWPDSMGIELMTGEHYTIAGDTIVPDSNYAGTLVVGVRVDDGTDTSDPFDFTLTVTPVNDAPVMGEVSSPVTVVAGEELTVAFTAEDPDDSILVVEGIDLPSTAMIVDGEADTAVLFWVPEKADTGTYNLVVTVTDGDLVDSVSLVIEVLTTAPKTPPRIASLPADTIAVADSLFTVMLSATDDDDSVVVFSMEGLPAEAELIEEGPMTATLRWTPGRADTGSYTVGIVAVGEDNLGDTASFELLVVSADTLVPVENAPQLDTASAIQANDTITLAGEPLSDTILFSDPDGDPVHLSLVAAPEGMTIDSLTGHLLWDPGDTAADTVVTVTVEATDTAGLSVSISFYVAVDVEEVEPWVLIRAHRNPVVTKIVDVFVKTSPNIGKVTGEIVIGGSTKTLSFTAVSGRRDVYHARNDGPTGGSCTVRVIAEMSDGTKKTYSRKGSF